MTDYDGLETAIVEWADKISPLRRPQDTVVKLVSEASELLDAVLNNPAGVPGELADVQILLMDLANMHGVDLADATRAKMQVNLSREWYEENGVIRRRK